MNARVLPTAAIASVAAVVAVALGHPEPDESAASTISL
jgi:hypothetical protein